MVFIIIELLRCLYKRRSRSLGVLIPSLFARFSVPEVMTRRQTQVKLPAVDPDRKQTFGARPCKKSHFRRPGRYMMPAKIEKAFLREDCAREDKEALLELCPVLKKPQLDFSCYAERYFFIFYLYKSMLR